MYLKLEKKHREKARNKFNETEQGKSYSKVIKKNSFISLILIIYCIYLFLTDESLKTFSICLFFGSIFLYLLTMYLRIKLINDFLSKEAK